MTTETKTQTAIVWLVAIPFPDLKAALFAAKKIECQTEYVADVLELPAGVYIVSIVKEGLLPVTSVETGGKGA